MTDYTLVTQTVTIDRTKLLDLRKNTKDTQKSVWTTHYKDLVKSSCPELLRSKKRGKRAGTRNRIRESRFKGKIKASLPSILLVNTNRLYNKIDELEAILTSNLLQNCCLLAVTETWLNSNILDSQIALDDYITVRLDRDGITTGKTIAGGLVLYINKHWCNSYKIINTHSSQYLETMAIRIRPYWLPREIPSITVLLVYCTIFQSTPVSVAKDTNKEVNKQVDDLERDNPDSHIIVLGDFNHASIKLPSYHQHVSCITRGDRTLDKCYTKMRDVYKTYKLPKIGRSDHHPVVLRPKHDPVSRSNITPVITTRNWSSENSEKPLCALETTDWSELVSNESDASTKCDIISNYISFCYDDCIPLVNKVMRHDKTWMTAKIQRLLIARSAALTYHYHIALNQLQSKIQYQIRKAKRSFAKQEEKQFNSSDRRSWSHLKKLLRLNNSKPKECNLPPDALNDFYLRFEKDLQPPSLPALSSQCPQMEVADVIKALRSINTKKSTGPDNIP